MSGAARARWRRPPNTISAPPISSRPAGVRPSIPSSPIPTMDSQRGDAALSRAAARQSGVPLLALRRPAWVAVGGDLWKEVADVAAAVRMVGDPPRRVFVTLGRNELGALTDAPQHFYLIRSVDPVDPPLPLPQVTYLTARGPFTEADDHALMVSHGIEAVIAKNGGGTASYGKIAAARALGIEVIMLRRPPPPDAPAVETVDAAI